MPELREVQARLLELREARDRARLDLRHAVVAFRELDAGIAAAERSGGREGEQRLDRLRREREEAARDLDRRKRDLVGAQATVRNRAAEWLTDPREQIGQLPDTSSFLLLPLRIETKFSGSSNAPELWIRLFPDDIAVALHEKALTTGELDAGQEYWRGRTRANGAATAKAREDGHRGAWTTLAGRYGSYRAGWLAKATKPNGWTEAMTTVAALVFPAVETKPTSWTEAPRSFVLPDRFVVTLLSGAQQRAFVGLPIPDDLLLGPDPLQTESLLTRDAVSGRITTDDDLRWLIDFDRAVASGMALRIPLTEPWMLESIEKVVVIGIRASADAEHSTQLLTRLFESHRYSRGISIVPQGTPTNNTESAKSGYTTAATTIDETFELEQNPASLVPSADPFAQRDGQRLAEALGLPLDTVRTMPQASNTDIAEAIAMNRALWPATFGGFLREMIKPLVADATIERTKRFVTRFVLGRGLIPAIRVGNQPYGIVATSALARWQWSAAETGAESPFWEQLLTHLVNLDSVWRKRLVPQVSQVGPSDDPFKHLLNVIGLQASSVEFYSRTAASDAYLWNYIKLKDTPTAFATEFWEQLQREKRNNLASLGLDILAPYKLKTLTFWRRHDRLIGPVVDGDPAIPLAEDRPIRPYDGAHNYIHWLSLASRAALEAETFTGADGKPVAAPLALLYQLLRHGYLSELGQGGLRFVKHRAAEIFAELPDEPSIANVGAAKTLLLHDVMNVDTSAIGVTHDSHTVADHLLQHARAATAVAAKPPEALPLADMTAALTTLAPLSTARLERLFAEHVDVCSYRLDAWIQGLFARRLETLREGRQQNQGVYLGAFGWVEHLRPNTANRRIVPPEQVPATLGPAVDGPVVQYTDSGGFVHAPSLTHAVSAAVLRNAYLSHAEPSRAGTMSVNLSSSRVRTALSYLEGLRNGQELAALLGYQLERGLHESHPGVELDEFIYVLRERFPLISKKLTAVPADQSADVIEARNVVNGYDLLETVRGKAYPYGILGLPADASRASAVQQEIDRLADAMDAIGDLLLAESVHQVVQGNYDRAKGVLQSVTEGEAPPDIDIVQTPRSGRGLTHRIALQFDPAQTSGWHVPLTVRAAANAPLNHWLASVLPASSRIQWQVTRGALASEFIDLDSLALEPLDLVLMCGDTFGAFSSELERFLVERYRHSHAVADDERAFYPDRIDDTVPAARRIIIDLKSAQANHLALAHLWPMLKSLRRTVSRSRTLHANDFLLATEAKTSGSANPKGIDEAQLKGRIEAAYASVKAIVDGLDGLLTGTVRPLYTALQNDPGHTIVPAWSGLMATMRKALVELARAGTPEALAMGGVSANEPEIDALVLLAETMVTAVAKRLVAARALLDTTFTDPLPADPQAAERVKGQRLDRLVDACVEAGRLIVGRSFAAVPLYTVHTGAQAELDAALTSPIESNGLLVEEWLQSLTRVRPAVGAFGWVLTYHDWLHAKPLALVPAQLPVRPGDAWIGSTYGTALQDGDVVSIAFCNPPTNVAAPLCGLMVDEWTEVAPTPRETTGLAFHSNRPNAQPPQALLLAVPPVIRGTWQWDDLLAVVIDTLERAKIRAVEPDGALPTDMIAGTEYFQMLPTVLTEFSQHAFVSTAFAAHFSALAQKA